MFEQPFYIVYKTTNCINGKIYVGVHLQKTDSFDGYFGSNKHLRRSIKKYGKQSFKRETLVVCATKEEAYDIEYTLVDSAFINRVDVYNEKEGGFGGSNPGRSFHKSESYRARRRESMARYKERLLNEGKSHPNLGRIVPEDKKQNYYGRNHVSGAEHHMTGISKEDHPKGFLGNRHAEETKSAISTALLEYYAANSRAPMSEETKLKLSNSKRGKPAHNKGVKVTDEVILNKMRKPRMTSTCPHCQTTGGGGNMKRYHFENCKERCV